MCTYNVVNLTCNTSFMIGGPNPVLWLLWNLNFNGLSKEILPNQNFCPARRLQNVGFDLNILSKIDGMFISVLQMQ